jgi:DNA-binding MurR/RpiR family transcriptional regulator
MSRYPDYHENEVWDPPEWVFSSVYTMTPREAARELGMSRPTLLKYSDALGLTVYRNWNRWRYYSRHEIMQLKKEAQERSIQEIMIQRTQDEG